MQCSYRVYYVFLLCGMLYTVAPTITIPPENALVKVGETATFVCVSSGIPQPMVKWYDELGNFLTEGTTLVREDVQQTGRNPQFICIVSSDAGSQQVPVTLTVYCECFKFLTLDIHAAKLIMLL